MKNNEQKMINEILGADFTQHILTEFGIQHATPEEQATLLDVIGQNILRRIMLEILTVLPESKRDEFEAFVGNKDATGFREFLEKNVPDFEDFVRHHATREFDATKTQLQMVRQGVSA